MGKKYIIEIPDDKIGDFIGSTHFLMPYMMAGHIGHHDTGLPINPYTEPDLEQVRIEAYQEGLADAWEAARKIANLVSGEQRRLFDCFGIYPIACRFSAHEAIEKLKTYEQEQEEIKVGDEVERILDGEVDSKAVFLEENNGYYSCLFWTGSFFTTLSYPKKQFRKTGRHFPEIAAVLEKMRGDQE